MPRSIENALTQQGAALIAKSLADGFPVSFTRAALGTGVAPDSADLSTYTALITPYANAELAGRSYGAGGSMLITAQFLNTNVTASTYIAEIGVFAADPAEGEILFSYLTFGQYPDLILSAADASVRRTYDIPYLFGSGDALSVTITPSGLMPSEDAVESPTPGKLLRLNADGKLPASITGDAITLGGHDVSYFAKSNHSHLAATAQADGYLSKEDKTALDQIKQRVTQGLTSSDTPTFAGLTIDGYIDGARFR